MEKKKLTKEEKRERRAKRRKQYRKTMAQAYHPSIGMTATAVRTMMQARESDGKIDKEYFGRQQSILLYNAAIALTSGLYWVEMQAQELLKADELYVSENARRLLEDRVRPSSDKVKLDVSLEALVNEERRPIGSFRIRSAVTVDGGIKDRLQPIDGEALLPVTDHKKITAYTELDYAGCFAKNSLALLSFDDLIGFADKKTTLFLNYGQGSVTYTAKELKEIKDTSLGSDPAAEAGSGDPR